MPQPPVVKTCLVCEKRLLRNARTFCSALCLGQHSHQQAVARGLQNCSAGVVRRYLIETRGAKCSKCGWCEINPKTQRVPITINHIDGNSENNAVDNLEILCPNCHSLTPNYGNLNYGHGRKKRRKAYILQTGKPALLA